MAWGFGRPGVEANTWASPVVCDSLENRSPSSVCIERNNDPWLNCCPLKRSACGDCLHPVDYSGCGSTDVRCIGYSRCSISPDLTCSTCGSAWRYLAIARQCCLHPPTGERRTGWCVMGDWIRSAGIDHDALHRFSGIDPLQLSGVYCGKGWKGWNRPRC